MYISHDNGVFTGFHPDWRKDNLPDNSIELDDDQYAAAYAAISAGTSYSIAGVDISPPPVTMPPETWDSIRTRRNELLQESDYTQLPDSPVNAKVWAAYRKQLRDITEKFSNPADVVWPTKPE